MITGRAGARQPTKQRLLEAGVQLFADRGFRETTVGDIEAAAGLEPRRGALYRHYRSKEDLLEAALEAHLHGLAATELAVEPYDATDPAAEALALGRWLLKELDRERAIVRILEQDGDRLRELRDRFRTSLVDPGYRVTTELARRWLGPDSDALDVEAASAVLLGGLVNYRRSAWTFGRPPAELDEERFLRNWAGLCTLILEAARARSRKLTAAARRTRP